MFQKVSAFFTKMLAMIMTIFLMRAVHSVQYTQYERVLRTVTQCTGTCAVSRHLGSASADPATRRRKTLGKQLRLC